MMTGSENPAIADVANVESGGVPKPVSKPFRANVGRRVGFLEAAKYPFKAMSHIVRHPSIWLWLLLPVAINVLVGYYTWVYAGGWVSRWMEGSVVAGSPLQEWFMWMSNAIVFIMKFAISVFAMIVVGNILIIPFNEWLSEKVDRDLGWKADQSSLTFNSSFSHMFLVARYELSRMSIYVSLMVPLFLLSLVPSVGFVTIPLQFIVTMFFLAMDNFSYSLDRRGHVSIGSKFQFLFARFMPAIGFGFGMTLFLMIPLVNFVFLPVGAIGATLLYWHMNPEGNHVDNHPSNP